MAGKMSYGKILVMAIGLSGITGCAGERPNNLGARAGLLTACPSSHNCVSSQTDSKQHQIAPLNFKGNSDKAFALLKRVLDERSDTTIIEDKPGYLRVELRTILFVDDGEFLLDREHSLIHIRSASRLGYSDLGKNRSRMEDIRTQFRAAETKP